MTPRTALHLLKVAQPVICAFNFDICLPEWLAGRIKPISESWFGARALLTAIRWATTPS